VADNDLVEGFLSQAEGLYGPRFPGATFDVQESPAGGELHSEFNPNTNHVIIRIPADRQGIDRSGALAQESIHLLSPAEPKDAKVFDLGLATLFAMQVCNYHPAANYGIYPDACAAVKRLYDLCPSAIRNLRQFQPQVALIREDDILRACSGLPQETAHFLVQPVY
jgi:hypothetical protein